MKKQTNNIKKVSSAEVIAILVVLFSVVLGMSFLMIKNVFSSKQGGASEIEIKTAVEKFTRNATAMGHIDDVKDALFNLDSYHIEKRASSCESAKKSLSKNSTLRITPCSVSEKIVDYYSIFTASLPEKITVKEIEIESNKKARAVVDLVISVINADLNSTDATSDGTGSIYERKENFYDIEVSLVREGKEWKVIQTNMGSKINQFFSLWNVGGDMVVSTQKAEKIGAFRLDKRERLYIPIEIEKKMTTDEELTHEGHE